MNKVTVTFNDKQGNRTEGWVDRGDTVTLQYQSPLDVLAGREGSSVTVSTKEFLSNPRFDTLGSPDERLGMLVAGGAQVQEGATLSQRKVEAFSRPNPFSNWFHSPAHAEIKNNQPAKTYRVGDWGEIVVDKARSDWANTRGLEENLMLAMEAYPHESRFTEALQANYLTFHEVREDLYAEKSQETKSFPETIAYCNSQIDEFVKTHPSWTREDVLQFNLAMGNSEMVNAIRVSEGAPLKDGMTMVSQGHVKIYLPNQTAQKVLEPELLREKQADGAVVAKGLPEIGSFW